jgi:hypothetical protein
VPPVAEAERIENLEAEIDPKLDNELLSYRGKWVAITTSRLIAVGESAADVLRVARDHGVESPILYHVPDGHGTAYIL